MALAPVPFAAWRRLGLYATPEYNNPEGATQTFKIGSVLVYTAGLVVESGDDPTAIAGVATAAGQNLASGVAKTQMIPPVSNIIFVGTLDDGTGTYPLAQTDLGLQYNIWKDSTTGLWYVDESETDAKRVTIVELIDPVGTLQGRVGFQFIRDYTFLGIGS